MTVMNMAMVEETTVPVLMIGPDWSIDEIETLEDCDEAFAVLTEQVAKLELEVGRAHAFFIETCKRAPWHDRAIIEQRMKRATLAILQNKRAAITRAEKQKAQETRDKKFIALFRELEPEAYTRVIAEASRRLDSGSK